jgi:hypothetical protein
MRVRLGVAFLTVFVVLVVAGIAISAGPRGPKTWTIELHETLTLPANEVHPGDVYRCEGWGAINGTPEVGTSKIGGKGSELYLSNDVDGVVTVSCETGGVNWAGT